MHSVRYILSVLLLALTIVSCKKDSLSRSECDSLKNGLVARDAMVVSKALEGLLTSYSAANLDKLAEKISTKCNTTASVLCFDCIKTNPSQSELVLSFSHSGIPVKRIIDVSYTNTNKMKIVNVHD